MSSRLHSPKGDTGSCQEEGGKGKAPICTHEDGDGACNGRGAVTYIFEAAAFAFIFFPFGGLG